MRFLFGVLTGGALTWAASLVVVDHMPSAGPVFKWLHVHLAPNAIVEGLRRAPTPDVADDEPGVDEPVAAPVPEPPESEQVATREPEQSDADPPTAPAQSSEESPAPVALADEERAEPTTPKITDAPPPNSLDDPPVVVGPQANGWESAWVPFQTQRSAQGFAQVLTRHVQHPFEVRREATHRYRVTFAYADETERERVLAAVHSIAGPGQ